MKAKRFTQGLLLIALAVIMLACVTEADASAWRPGSEGWEGDISLSTPAPGKTQSTDTKATASPAPAAVSGGGSFTLDVSVKNPLMIGLGALAFISFVLFAVFMILNAQKKKKAVQSAPVMDNYAGPTMPIVQPPVRPTKYMLRGRGGYQDGRIFEIRDKVTIGRAVDCSIPYPASYSGISRQHCTLIKRGDRLFLVDTSSTGTYLERTRSRLPVQTEVEVFVNDVFYLGEKKNMFCIEGR